MNQKNNIKTVIKRRIDLVNNQVNSSNKPKLKNQKRNEKIIKTSLSNTTVNKYNYEEQKNLDYDVIITIASYNRYDKLKRILDKLYEDNTKYTFKIIILNDGSSQDEYFDIPKSYGNLILLNNDVNGGIKKYWQTINKLWNEVKNYKTHAMCQMDDDFILCDNFLNRLMDSYLKKIKENINYAGLRYHLGVLENNMKKNNGIMLDGGSLFNINFLKSINYHIEDMTNKAGNNGSFVWQFINNHVKKTNKLISYVDKSLVLHDGNEDSKMHSIIRRRNKYITLNYIDNNDE